MSGRSSDVLRKQADGSWQHNAIEINLRKGGTTHPLLTLQFLTDGRTLITASADKTARLLAAELGAAAGADEGCRALVAAIEREPAKACVPSWPWTLIGWYMRNAPLAWIAKMS